MFLFVGSVLAVVPFKSHSGSTDHSTCPLIMYISLCMYEFSNIGRYLPSAHYTRC